MARSVGIRIKEDRLEKFDELASEEQLDRSTLIRRLLEEGYERYLKKKAAEEYKKGKITISKAAERAGVTVWEMENFLVEEGYVSSYSVKDLEEEMENWN